MSFAAIARSLIDCHLDYGFAAEACQAARSALNPVIAGRAALAVVMAAGDEGARGKGWLLDFHL